MPLGEAATRLATMTCALSATMAPLPDPSLAIIE